MRFPILVAASVILLGSLNGCIGGAALMALSAAGGAAAIAKDVFDVDVDIHTLLGQSKPAVPTPPVVLLTHPEYLVVTPPNPSLDGK